MKDQNKTKTQLISELLEMRRHLSELKKSETARKQAENTLRESHAKLNRLNSLLRLMCDNLPELIWAKDLQGKFMFVNKSCCEDLLNARDVYEPIGKTDIFFAEREKQSHPENPSYHTFGETCSDSDGAVLETQKTIRGDESGTIKGKFVIIDVVKSPFWDENGKLIGTVGCARDVTRERNIENERKQAEDKLVRSNRILQQERNMFIAGPVVTFKWQNKEGWPVEYVSPNIKEVFDYSAEELISGEISYAELIPSEDIERVANEVAINSQNGVDSFTHQPYRIVRKDGKIIWIDDYTTILRNENGDVTHYLGYIIDITERKQAEKEKEIFHQLSLRLTNPLSLKEAGKIIAGEAQRLFNFDSISLDIVDKANDMIVGIYTEDTMKGDKKPKEMPAFSQRLKSVINKDVLNGKPKLINHDKKPDSSAFYTYGDENRLSMSLMFVPLKYENKTIGIITVQSYTVGKYKKDDLQLLQIFADHAGGALVRLQVENALRESEERFRAVFETAQDSIFIKDRNLRYTQVNPAMERLFGLSADKMIGRTDEELFGEESGTHIIDVDSRVLNGDIVKEEHTKSVNGVPLAFNVIKVPMREAARKIIGLCGIARDITERKRAEKEKEDLRAQLYQNQKLESIGTLASGIAHEVNNPLMGIINYAQLINESIKEEKLKHFSKGIVKEGERVAKIVKNLLSFARQDKEQHSPAKIDDIINASLMLFGAVFRKNQIQIIQDIPNNLPKVKCRSQQIEQVLVNLITNAKDALNQRYPDYHKNKILKIAVKPFKKEKIDWIRITVEDHGLGIPDKVIGRIFDPFFTTKPRDEGTGLGLSVSYGIIKEHKGELTVESESGEFSKFYIDLRVNNG